MSSTLATLSGVALGGLLTAGATFGIESVKERRARARESREFARKLETRWDDKLAQVAGEFVSTTRALLHTARRIDRSVAAVEARQLLEQLHERLHSLFSELGPVADRPGQAARDIIRLTYRLRELGERGASQDEQDAAHDGVLKAIAAFQLPVRRQLRVPDPEDVLDEDEYRATTAIPRFTE